MATHRQGQGKQLKSVQLSAEMWSEIDALASASGMNVSAYCTAILIDAAAAGAKLRREDRIRIFRENMHVPPREVINGHLVPSYAAERNAEKAAREVREAVKKRGNS